MGLFLFKQDVTQEKMQKTGGTANPFQKVTLKIKRIQTRDEKFSFKANSLGRLVLKALLAKTIVFVEWTDTSKVGFQFFGYMQCQN